LSSPRGGPARNQHHSRKGPKGACLLSLEPGKGGRDPAAIKRARIGNKHEFEGLPELKKRKRGTTGVKTETRSNSEGIGKKQKRTERLTEERWTKQLRGSTKKNLERVILVQVGVA